MKLKNKKTGIIGELHFEPDKKYHFTVVTEDPADVMIYKKLAALYAEWEDYEEPKGKALYWMILTLENFIKNNPDDKWLDLEDCKQMLEKLKAWKRLQDKGFRFSDFVYTELCDYARVNIKATMINDSINDDLNLLFGGEE